MIAIINGKIITPKQIIENKVLLIEDDKIVGIAEETGCVEKVIDAHHRYVTPGFIDIHSDKIEQFICPRPTAQMDFELALKECERELLLQGITTMYHSMSLFKDGIFGRSPLRTKGNVIKLANLIGTIHERFHLIRHRFHLRIEIDNLEAYEIVKEMMEKELVHQISFMDHTPGQGQYKNLDIYRKAISRDFRGDKFEDLLAYHEEKEMLSFEKLKELTEIAHSKGIAVASHDDDCVKKLEINRAIGVDISEFPIDLETALKAKEMNFHTIVGAPNIILGGSHSGNMSAATAILEKSADIICSDYYPPAMLHSIFYMNKNYGVPITKMIEMVTLNPARAVKIDDQYGSIESGKKADINIIDLIDGYPVITHSLIDGKTTSRVEYRRTV